MAPAVAGRPARRSSHRRRRPRDRAARARSGPAPRGRSCLPAALALSRRGPASPRRWSAPAALARGGPVAGAAPACRGPASRRGPSAGAVRSPGGRGPAAPPSSTCSAGRNGSVVRPARGDAGALVAARARSARAACTPARRRCRRNRGPGRRRAEPSAGGGVTRSAAPGLLAPARCLVGAAAARVTARSPRWRGSCAVTASSPPPGFGTPMTLPSGSRMYAGLPALTRPSLRAGARPGCPGCRRRRSAFSSCCCWSPARPARSCSCSIWNEFSFVLVLTSRMPSTPATTSAITSAMNGARGALIGARRRHPQPRRAIRVTLLARRVELQRGGALGRQSGPSRQRRCPPAADRAAGRAGRARRLAPGRGAACSVVRPPDRGAVVVRSLMSLPLLAVAPGRERPCPPCAVDIRGRSRAAPGAWSCWSIRSTARSFTEAARGFVRHLRRAGRLRPAGQQPQRRTGSGQLDRQVDRPGAARPRGESALDDPVLQRLVATSPQGARSGPSESRAAGTADSSAASSPFTSIRSA